MKSLKFLLSLFCFFLVTASYAGNDTLYFNKNQVRIETSTGMSFYRLPVVKTDSGYRVVEYHRNGKVKMIAYALNEGCSIYHGYKTIYDTLGRKKTEGNLAKGMRSGVWTEYWSNGKIVETMIYRNDDLNGMLIHYDSTGKKQYELEYKDDYLNGFATRYYTRTGNIYTREHFKNDKPDSARLVYYENGALKRKDDFVWEKNDYKGKCYDIKGDKIAYFPFSEKAVAAEEDFIKKIYTRLKATTYFSGKVTVSFDIDEKGEVGAIRVWRQDGDEVPEEMNAIVAGAAGKWKPGKVDGKLTTWKYRLLMDMGTTGTYQSTKIRTGHRINY